METRQILIANQKTQKKYNLQSSATTLKELKAQLDAQGIDYSGMTFTEGLSKTQLISDDSLLPTNVMYKNAPTNNLVMVLTDPNKKIASGVDYPKDRKLFSAYIKNNNLSAQITEKYGNNWTRLSTSTLIKFFEYNSNRNHTNQNLGNIRKELNKLQDIKESTKEDFKAVHPVLVNYFCQGIEHFVNANLLHVEDIKVINKFIGNFTKQLIENTPVLTEEAIDDIVADI